MKELWSVRKLVVIRPVKVVSSPNVNRVVEFFTGDRAAFSLNVEAVLSFIFRDVRGKSMSLVKRSVMNLYSGAMDPDSHKVRIVLAEKAVAVEVTSVDINHPSEDLLHLNPYNTLPTLVDRELVLYEPQVIMEYLDERFPHPPLLSVYPVARAKSRLMLHRIEQDWYSLMRTILHSDDEFSVESARSELREGLLF